MPALMALGMLANPIGLLLAVQFILLATLLLMVVAQALLLVQDSFPFYPFGAPVEKADEWTKEELADAGNGHPTTPEEECPFGEQLMSEQEFIEHYARSMFGGPPVGGCGTRLPNFHDLITLLDLAALVLSLVGLAVMGVYALAGCVTGGMMGCIYGGIAGAIAMRTILTAANFLGFVSAIVACAAGAYEDRGVTGDCIKGSAGAILGYRNPVPALDWLIDAAVLWCFDLRDEGRACRFVNGSLE